MAVQMLCPNLSCRKVLSVPDEVRGKTVKCIHCQAVFKVPAGKSANVAQTLNNHITKKAS